MDALRRCAAAGRAAAVRGPAPAARGLRLHTHRTPRPRYGRRSAQLPWRRHGKGRHGVSEHPIQGLMQTAMEAIKGMVDVGTVIGDAVETKGGTLVIPVSSVSFG